MMMLTLILFRLFFIFSFFSIVSWSVPINGLQASYSFSGNANDESGNGNNGTIIGASGTTDRFGNENSALFFDGTGDFVSINNNFSGYSNFSYSFWFKYSGSSISNTIVQTSNGVITYLSNSNEFTATLNIDRSGGLNAQIYRYRFSVGDMDDKWHNGVFIGKSDNTGEFYLDGIKVDMGDRMYDGGQQRNVNVGMIGSGYDTFSNVFLEPTSGFVDDINIYNKALDISEIYELSETESVPEPTTLILIAMGFPIVWFKKKKRV